MNNRSDNTSKPHESRGAEQRELDKNKTLKDDESDVVDYDRSEQKARESQTSGTSSKSNQGDGDIPLSNDETIGNP